jgi:hypothetical protein
MIIAVCQMPNENEDILQKLAPSIVEIISNNKEVSSTLGTVQCESARYRWRSIRRVRYD